MDAKFNVFSLNINGLNSCYFYHGSFLLKNALDLKTFFPISIIRKITLIGLLIDSFGKEISNTDNTELDYS